MKKNDREKRTSKLMKKARLLQDDHPYVKTSFSIEEEYDSEKKRRKHLQSEVRKLEKKVGQQKRLNQKLKKDAATSEKMVSTLKRELWELNEKQNQEEKRYVEKANVLKESLEKERTKRIQVEKVNEQLEAARGKKNKGSNKLLELSNQVKQLKESNQAYRHKLENYDLLKKQEYGNLNKQLENLTAELDRYKALEKNTIKNPAYLLKNVKTQLNKDNIPDLLKVLETFITIENVRYFYRGFDNVFYRYMKRVSQLNYQSKKLKLQNSSHRSRAQRLGYVTRDAEGWWFVETTKGNDGLSYPIKNQETVEGVPIDCPVKVFLENGEATIMKILHWEQPEEGRSGMPQIKAKKAEQREYIKFGTFRVLVIGSRFLHDYKERIERHGGKVEIHNPYEESYTLMEGKMNRADIILVCERHVPHSVWGHVDKNVLHVSVLKNDSKDMVSTITYLTLERCGLI